MAKKADTGDYSATKAPDTRKHAEEQVTTPDFRLKPGGRLGAPALQGMAGLEPQDVPADAADAEQQQHKAEPK